MQIEIRKGLVLKPGTYSAVICPESVITAALNSNADLQRFLFLYVSGNYSRILSGISRTSTNFEIRRAFTAHQLFTALREAAHTIVFVEHDPTLFDGATEMAGPVARGLKRVGPGIACRPLHTGTRQDLFCPGPDRRPLCRDRGRRDRRHADPGNPAGPAARRESLRPADAGGGIVMGRTFPSVRQGANHVADRWARSSKALKKEDREYGDELVKCAKTHTSEAFVACDDPLEAATFSALVEILRRQKQLEEQVNGRVDP